DRGAGRPPRRGRQPHRHRAEGRGPLRPDPAAPGVLLLPVRRRRTAPADPPSRAQADLARGVDQQLLRPPRTGRGDPGGRPSPRAPGARCRGRGRGPRAPRVPLPGGDAGRDPGERDVPGVRRACGSDPRPGPRRGRRDVVGGLVDLQRRCGGGGAGGLPVVSAAGRRAPGGARGRLGGDYVAGPGRHRAAPPGGPPRV
ncbi:MAG: Isopentenyl-diphosphate Delta-isomerase, partial [uncultured Friedmanniella sp.]